MDDEKNKLNSEELKKLKAKLEECQKFKDEYLAGWQRARADFLNYKKEELERIGEILKYGNLELILEILPILDNFDLVERKLLSEDLKNNENPEGPPTKIWWGAYGASVKGILQIKNQILDLLKRQGVGEIKCLGEKFDPNFQEVVEEIETKDKESGIVLEEVQKGYTMDGRLIRPAKVKVSK